MDTTILDQPIGYKSRGHGSSIIFYCISKMLERASYYGLRAILVLYIMNGLSNVDAETALSWFGYMSSGVLLSAVLGAVIGDLIIGNRKAILGGAIVQALGCFLTAIPTEHFLFLGMFCILLGNGFYTPNLSANFGKQYLDNRKLLDAGFSLFYLFVNIGAAFGVAAIGFVSEVHGFHYGFILAGLLMVLSFLPMLITKEVSNVSSLAKTTKSNYSVINILVSIFLMAIFWIVYELGNIELFEIQAHLVSSDSNQSLGMLLSSMNAILLVPLGVFAYFYWTNKYSSSFIKLFLGFVFLAITIGGLMLLPDQIGAGDFTPFLIFVLLMSVAEIFIGPMLFSILTQYSNPQYLAIVMSLSALPIRIIGWGLGSLHFIMTGEPSISLILGFVSIIIMALIAFGLHHINSHQVVSDL